MNIRRRLIDTASKTAAGERAVHDRRYRMVLTASISLVLNLSYAVYHGVLGILGHSWWFSALWAYYTILGVTRFGAVLCERKNDGTPVLEMESFVLGASGVLLLLLSCVLAGVNYMSLTADLDIRYGTITMITIATYTFVKLTLAVIRVVRHRHDPSPLLAAIRRIGYAEVAVSVLTLQRSMLVSFGAEDTDMRAVMNGVTGAAVYLFVFFMGILMIRESRGKKDGDIKNCKGE